MNITKGLKPRTDTGVTMLGPLPMATEISPAEDGEAEGSIQCQKGSKLVLFVTKMPLGL